MFNILKQKSSHYMLHHSRHWRDFCVRFRFQSNRITNQHFQYSKSSNVQGNKKYHESRVYYTFGQGMWLGKNSSNSFFSKLIINNSKSSIHKHAKTSNLVKTCSKSIYPNFTLSSFHAQNGSLIPLLGF